MSGPAVYVASPLGFSVPGSRYLEQILHPALWAAGFEVLDPWERGRQLLATQPPSLNDQARNSLLGEKNTSLIAECSALIGILDGPDVDSGTAAEIGYAAGIGRVVVGLRTDLRMAGENLGAPVNLQVLHFLTASGGTYTTDLDEAIGELRSRVGERTRCSRIFHIASRSTWEAAKASGSYVTSTRDQSLDEVGFIHCSFGEQLGASANRFYRDADASSLLVLAIDPERLDSPLLIEPTTSGEDFPHIHGPLNPSAVVATLVLTSSADGLAIGRASSP